MAEYAHEHPEGFTYGDLINQKIIVGEEEENIIKIHFDNANHKARYDAKSTLDTMFIVIQLADGYKSKCTLTFDAFFNYFDYLELQEGRKNSKQAMRTAIIAIILSLLAIVVQIYTSSSTQIDKGQFDEVKALIQNIK